MKFLKKQNIFAWSLYDFANQPFSTIIVTFVYSTFFVEFIAPNDKVGTSMWTNSIAICAIIVSIVSPLIGAVADTSNIRKKLIILFTCLCSLFTMLLYFPQEGDYFFALLFFIIANISFELCSVLYNSYLLNISNNDNIGSISGFAWGLGYIGGIISLLLCFLLFDFDESIDVRRVNILVGIWFLIFSFPFLVKINSPNIKLHKYFIKDSFNSIITTFKNISNHKIILKFLIARLFYNDALVTIFTLGGIYAVGTLGFTLDEVIILGIVLNVAAGIGSFFFGYFEDRFGFKKIINLSLLVLIFSTLLAFIAPFISYSKLIFWISGVLIGLMVGPNQSTSRSIMARLTPDSKKNQFFGFYALAGKATSFIGPFLFGIITLMYNQQIALLIVVILFLVGFILFNRIKFNSINLQNEI